MNLSFAHRSLMSTLGCLMLTTSVLAQTPGQTPGQTPAQAAVTKQPLSDNENPALIGKRNINKHQINFYSLDKEVAIGRQFAQEIDRSAKLVDDAVIAEYVNRVGQNLVLHSDAKVPFTIKVIDSDEVNAFALPGGFFYVNKGLILTADNEAELAGPMAHEIAHVAARHGVEQASKGQIVNWGTLPLIFLGGWGGFAIQQAAALAIPLGFLKFSRAAEEEADIFAAQYLWASGYDPHALVTFFEKLQAKEKKKPGTMSKIFSTHPVVGSRIERVTALISRFPDRSEYTINTSEFNTVKNRLVAQTNARATTASRGGTVADRDAQRPSLKKRQPPAPGGTSDPSGTPTSSDGKAEPTADRPTLRKKGDSTPPAKTPEP